MNTPRLQQVFTDYLQTCYRLGQRHLELPDTAVHLLRTTPGTRSSSPAQARTNSGPPPALTLPTPRPAPQTTPEPEKIALPAGDKATQMQALAEAILASSTCRSLFRRYRKMVLGTGHLDARLMFIGEAPGEEEDLQGQPFVGPAGQLLNKMIAAMGLQREEVYIANICKFRPDMPPGATGNRKPTPDEMAACLPFLKAQISIIQPEVIVALGATAVEGLFRLPRAPITRMRGQWMTWEHIPVMPTYHPAYLLRNASLEEKRRVWEDLLQVMEKLQMPISTTQKNYFLPRSRA